MNERIKEFLKQACIYQPERFDGIDGSNQLNKFAELIVQECVEICMKEIDTGLLMAPQAPCIAKQIKEHFEVKE